MGGDQLGQGVPIRLHRHRQCRPGAERFRHLVEDDAGRQTVVAQHFDTVWTPDHFYGFDRIDDPFLECWTTLTWLAATFPQLNEAFRVIDAWGFKYKTLAFLWLKQNRKADSWFYGMGFWTRSNAEVCLLATRGRPKRQCAGIHQFVISHIEQHSKKPDEVRDKIVKLMGDQPRVELFARQKTPGWDVWGNEVNCTLTMPERKG